MNPKLQNIVWKYGPIDLLFLGCCVIVKGMLVRCIFKTLLGLRIPDSYHAKTLKIHTPPGTFCFIFSLPGCLCNAKSALTFENCPLMAEVKF